MYAIQRTFLVAADKHEQTARTWRERILPHLQAQDGFVQGYLLQGTENFSVFMIWESEAAFNTYHESPSHQEIHGWLHDLAQGRVQKSNYAVL